MAQQSAVDPAGYVGARSSRYTADTDYPGFATGPVDASGNVQPFGTTTPTPTPQTPLAPGQGVALLALSAEGSVPASVRTSAPARRLVKRSPTPSSRRRRRSRTSAAKSARHLAGMPREARQDPRLAILPVPQRARRSLRTSAARSGAMSAAARQERQHLTPLAPGQGVALLALSAEGSVPVSAPRRSTSRLASSLSRRWNPAPAPASVSPSARRSTLSPSASAASLAARSAALSAVTP